MEGTRHAAVYTSRIYPTKFQQSFYARNIRGEVGADKERERIIINKRGENAKQKCLRSRDDCNKNRIAVKFSNDTSGRRVVVARRQESIEKEVPSVVVCMCGRERAKRERTNEKESNKANLMNGRPNFF